MTEDKVELFRIELNWLLSKHNIRIVEIIGPMMVVKEDRHGSDYSGVMERNKKNLKQNTWTISAPWGG